MFAYPTNTNIQIFFNIIVKKLKKCKIFCMLNNVKMIKFNN